MIIHDIFTLRRKKDSFTEDLKLYQQYMWSSITSVVLAIVAYFLMGITLMRTTMAAVMITGFVMISIGFAYTAGRVYPDHKISHVIAANATAHRIAEAILKYALENTTTGCYVVTYADVGSQFTTEEWTLYRQLVINELYAHDEICEIGVYKQKDTGFVYDLILHRDKCPNLNMDVIAIDQDSPWLIEND